MKLLGEWAAAGQRGDDFWRQTPRAVRAIIDASARRLLSGAWHGAWLQRVKDFPELTDLLGVERRMPSGDELARRMEQWEVATAEVVQQAA